MRTIIFEYHTNIICLSYDQLVKCYVFEMLKITMPVDSTCFEVGCLLLLPVVTPSQCNYILHVPTYVTSCNADC